jgi:ABC-type glycerol-3-phosphate transport system substrate-binding protein
MKGITKRLPALLLALIFVFAMAACGGSDSGGAAAAPTTAPAPAASEPAAEPAAEAPPAAVVEEDSIAVGTRLEGLPDVNLTNKKVVAYAIGADWIEESHSQTELPSTLDICESEYGMEFEVVSFADWGLQLEVMTGLYMANDMPDLYLNANFPTDLMNDFVQPLDDMIDFNHPMWNDVRDIMKMIEWNGKNFFTVNYPWGFSDTIFYNPQIFAANAMETPNELFDKGEWTWDKLKQIAEALTFDEDGDNINDQWGLGWASGAVYLHTLTGVPLVEIHPDKTVTHNLRHPVMVECAEYFASLGPNGSNCMLKDGGDISQDYVEQQFGAGNVAILIGGWWRGGRDDIIGNWAKNLVDVAPPPSWKGGPLHTSGQVGSSGVCKNAKNPEAAALYLMINKWCGTDAYDAKFNPNKREYVDQTDIWKITDEQLAHMRRNDELAKAVTEPVPILHWIFWNWDDGFYDALTQPWSQVLERLEPEAQAGIDEKMEKLKYIN